MVGNLRICFIGDSFTQGIGDAQYRGWVGRILEATGPDITAFNLGIRRNTSEDIARRCWQEVSARTLPEADNRLVVSFGSNDAVVEDGRLRVEPSRTLDNLSTLLAESRRRGLTTLVVGPPPVVVQGGEHLDRLLKLSEKMAALCAERDVPFIDVTRRLATDPVWVTEATAGDGAHPGAGGYGLLAELVLGGDWLGRVSRQD